MTTRGDPLNEFRIGDVVEVDGIRGRVIKKTTRLHVQHHADVPGHMAYDVSWRKLDRGVIRNLSRKTRTP